MQGADVGMVQCRDRVRFALEAFGKLFVGNLNRDGAIQSRVTRLVDFSHAASAQWCNDLVGAQQSSGSQGHKVKDCNARDMSREWITGNSEVIHMPAAVTGN